MIAIVAAKRTALSRLSVLYRATSRAIIDCIGPGADGVVAEGSIAPFNSIWVAALTLYSALDLLIVAIAQYASRMDVAWGAPIFWSALFLLAAPIAFRLVGPGVHRMERIALLLLLAECSYAINLLFSPTRLSHFDEMLHWITAADIVRTRELFSENTLLPISPLYPGLEILTTGLANLSQMPLFGTMIVILVVLRGLLITVLFLLYEKISGSAWLAAVGCLFFMGNSSYVLFDALFAYESLAIVLLGLVLFTSMEDRTAQHVGRRPSILVVLITAALAVTHHVTGAVAAMLLAWVAVLKILSRHSGWERRSAAVIAAIAVIMMVAWSFRIGNPVVNYLGPVLQAGIKGAFHSATGAKQTREAFVAADGTHMPLALQWLGIASVAIIAAGLATGFMRSLALGSERHERGMWFTLLNSTRCRWVNHHGILLTLLTLGWPLSIILRLTPGGWEIGNRMGPYVFFGVGFVVAVAITRCRNKLCHASAAAAVACAVTVVYVGGVVTGWGVDAAGTHYKVEADAASIEPMGIDAAIWTREWLGPHNRFVTDRINQLLIAAYGDQTTVTTLAGDDDPSYLFVWPDVSAGTVATLKIDDVDYMLTDLRITTARPVLGIYFNPGEDEFVHAHPPLSSALLKYDSQPLVGRLFDNGYEVIYDMRALRDAQ